MTSLATAKILFFIGLTLAPQRPHLIFATSNSDNYVWTAGSAEGWSLRTKGLPTSDWHFRGWQQEGAPDDRDARAISRCQWHDGTLLDLPDGNQVKWQGDNAFFIVDPGAANQKVYTIGYPQG